MAFSDTGYYYDSQIKNYTLQFMAIFSGLHVQMGKFGDSSEQLITVPIHYGHPDRVVASVISNNTQNTPLRLPIMSAYVKNLRLDHGRMHGQGVERRTMHVPVGGLIPDDIKVVHQRMSVPYTIEMELGIMCSNTEQHFQILEQILPLFEPMLQLQNSDGPYDMSQIFSVELTGTQIDSPYPVSTKQRMIQSTLSFEMPVWLSIPANVKRDFIERIYVRMGVVNLSSTTSGEILQDLDDGGFAYDLVADGKDIQM